MESPSCEAFRCPSRLWEGLVLPVSSFSSTVTSRFWLHMLKGCTSRTLSPASLLGPSMLLLSWLYQCLRSGRGSITARSSPHAHVQRRTVLSSAKKDWYPKHIEVQQEGTAITVTFNLAPPNLGIRSYFSLCYANGIKKYTDIIPNSNKNKTHHSYQLNDLQEGTNYTCEIAANEVDAVRKTFNVQVMRIQKEGASSLSVTPSLALMVPLCLAVVAILVVLLTAFTRRRPKLQMKKLDIKPDIIKQHQESGTQEEVMALPRNRLTPPRLLICYSSYDGPAHVKAVMHLGAFIQQHMATQVCLDLWDSMSVTEEGSMAWHCRQIRECDFILVICSWGFNHRPKSPEPEGHNEDEEADSGMDFGSNAFSSDVAVQLVGEEVGRAKARGQDLSKYMTAIFEYSEETDIPTELRLVSHYTLTSDLQLLFSHLHGVALHRPGGYLKINHISEEGFSKLPAGVVLQWAIYEAGIAMRAKGHHSVEGRALNTKKRHPCALT
ncbi:interleukin-17 receptor D isoform X2 [Siniperca chuatsi]|uniref:interleukin-17 receptor D isoform X2 n=1 Tax=Siniperca chuatsi TaxID=119488 RepID=UPI001CE20AFA|nr:interleukin-17 receptor D isoform X2 [Siniperca chuatsi]